MVKITNIEAAGKHVGHDEDAQLPGTKLARRRRALLGRSVAKNSESDYRQDLRSNVYSAMLLTR